MIKQKISATRIGRVLTLASLIFVAGLLAAQAQTTAFTYQGKLNDGATAASGGYDLQFALFDAETSGAQIGTTLVRPNVNVSNGIFTVTLNFGASPFASTASRFLQIAVKKPSETNYTTLTPRQQLTASPYSIRTLSAIAADSLSSACIGCVSDQQINSIDGAKITGTITNATAANANTANTANESLTALNVSGIVAIVNGGTGSSTKNFVDTTTAQTIDGVKTFSGNLRTNGFVRSGSETGTSQLPTIPDYLGGYNGLITRRINSDDTTEGQVIARTNNMRIERDGTAAGWRVAYNGATNGGGTPQSVYCLGIDNSGGIVVRRLLLGSTAPGTAILYTNAQNIEYMQCSFGSPYSYGHQTQVTVQRAVNDYIWVGTITSTLNQ